MGPRTSVGAWWYPDSIDTIVGVPKAHELIVPATIDNLAFSGNSTYELSPWQGSLRVYVNDIDVNRELVAHGFAWVYCKYSKDAELLKLEAQAREQGLGLWADPNPIPPWEWQRGHK